MAVDIKGALTRKLGPLQTWQWGLIGAGGIWLWRMYSRGSQTEAISDPGLTGEQGTIYPVPVGSGAGGAINSGFEIPTEEGRLTLYGSGGQSVDVSGPFDYVERVLGGLGGFLQPAPAPRVSEPAPAQPKPTGGVVTTATRTTARISIPTYEYLRAAVLKTGHNPGSVVNESDVMAALRRKGWDPKTAINASDINALFYWSRTGRFPTKQS